MTVESDLQEATGGLSFIWFLVLLMGFLGTVVGIGYLIAQNTGASYVDVMNIVGVLASITLSGILAYLYLRMSDIQSQQEDIMRSQQNLMEAEHRPYIYIENFEIGMKNLSMGLIDPIVDSTLNYDYGEFNGLRDDEVEITMANVGNGLAKELRIKINIQSLDSTEDFSYEYESLKLPLIKDQKSEEVDHTKQQRRIEGENWENYLNESEKGMFWVFPRFGIEDGKEILEVPFGIITDILRQNGAGFGQVEIGIVYEDMSGAEYYKFVTKSVIFLDEASTLQEAVGRGNLIRDGQTYPPEDTEMPSAEELSTQMGD